MIAHNYGIGASLTHNVMIVNRLRKGERLEDLADFYQLTIARHPSYNNLVQLHHTAQTQMGPHWTLVRQCHGLILDEADNWHVIARPVDRFFSIDKQHESTDKIDWSRARVTEYLDGKNVFLFYYDKKWHPALRTNPDASGVEVRFQSTTWAELFWDTFNANSWKVPAPTQKHFTFGFVLTSPLYRRVVPHGLNSLRLVYWRFNESGSEIAPVDSFQYWPAREFSLKDEGQIRGTLAASDPFRTAGYVVADHKWHRAYVWHPGYITLREHLHNTPIRWVIDHVRGKSPMIMWDDWDKVYGQILAAYDTIVGEIDSVWQVHRTIEERKDFALAVNHLPYADILFALRDSKVASVKEALRGASDDLILDLLKLGGL